MADRERRFVQDWPRVASARARLWIALLVLVSPSAPLAGETPAPMSSHALYRAGEVEAARRAAREELVAIETSGDPRALWGQLSYLAWLEESLGQPRRALEYAHRALDVALSLEDDFRIGRSLCWAGWASASLGHYALALELFERAIEIGAPDGRIAHVAVWGLATQEKGWVLARLGELDDARALIRETTDFARRHGILAGVAEGGAHLAELALLAGDLREAEERADEALRASLRCDCRAANTARARVVVARVAVARAAVEPKRADEASERAREALAYATQIGDGRHRAEAGLVLSRALPREAVEERLALVEEASELLAATGADLRGRAEGELGRVLADADYREMAGLYLRSGLEISESLLREVDAAYLLHDLAALDAAAGQSEASTAGWQRAADRARASGAWPLALDAEEALAQALVERGHLLQALPWTERALATLERLVAASGDRSEQGALRARRLALLTQLAELRLALASDAPGGP